MTGARPPRTTDSEDRAWVGIPVAQPLAEVARCCGDIEFLLRLNPYYEFKAWEQTAANGYAADIVNHSNGRRLATTIDVERPAGQRCLLSYGSGLKRRTVIDIRPAAHGSRIEITDDYASATESERKARLAEVDKSLPAWGEAVSVYFKRRRRWSWLPGWRWYMHRVWIRMTPAARRIVWWLYLITVAEFGFFLFVLLIFVIEQQH